MATFEEKTIPVRGGTVQLKRGEIATSYRFLAERWGWGRDKVRRTIEDFKKEGKLRHQSDNVTSIISIVNYDTFQGVSDTKPMSDATSDAMSNTMSNSAQYKEDIRRDKKGQEDKEKTSTCVDEKKTAKRFVPPTIEDVKQYADSIGYAIDAERFVDHYTANDWVQKGGQKIKDWKAAVRLWKSNDAKKNEQTLFQGQDQDPLRIEGKSYCKKDFIDAGRMSEYWDINEYIRKCMESGKDVIYKNGKYVLREW